MSLTSSALIVAAASPRGAKAPPRRAPAATTAAMPVSSLTIVPRVNNRARLCLYARILVERTSSGLMVMTSWRRSHARLGSLIERKTQHCSSQQYRNPGSRLSLEQHHRLDMRRVWEHAHRPDELVRAPGRDARYLIRLALQTHFAGELSTLPALSVARTRKVCLPFLTLIDLGELQAFHLPLSSLQANFEPCSSERKRKLAFASAFFVFTVRLGWDLIVVWGGEKSSSFQSSVP